ncbi:MAG: DUF4276 family protein [Bryobacteraceae bacterium]
MARLLVHVEGKTEETFVNEVLAWHLHGQGYTKVSARRVGNHRRRGGVGTWESAKREILGHLKNDRDAIATTMLDFYGMPTTWPGRETPCGRTSAQKASSIEDALASDIRASIDTPRFVPFVMMHEFEAMLFSDCAAFSREIGRPELEPALLQIRHSFKNPEEINDSLETAPSKRLLALMPDYQKPLFGALAALEIGLKKIRAECPHFDGWVRRLEALAAL